MLTLNIIIYFLFLLVLKGRHDKYIRIMMMLKREIHNIIYINTQ